ncbi:MAG: O-antigen ligase domain-containing protein [Acidobacteria bacterium]|nr:MAG: O-antigen ligase domain-containing protein [Acidobacteriota bacterium]
MENINSLVSVARAELPRTRLARWASVFFSLSVLTYLVSIAITQAFLAVSGLLFAAHLLHDRPRITFPAIKLPMLFFCLFTVISVFWATNSAAGWFAVRKLVLFLIILLAINLIASSRHLVWLWKGLFIEAAIVALVAAVQFARQYRAVRAEHPHHVYAYMITTRITGLMGDWMNFGGQQMLVFLVLAAFLLFVVNVRRIWWAVAAVVALSIALNLTRGVWLGCFFALVYLLWRWKPKWVLALPMLAIVIYLFAPRVVHERLWLALHPSHDPALSIRFEMWEAGLNMIKAHPWVGVGPNNIPQVYDLYLPPRQAPEAGFHEHLHDNFIQFAAERGLPCLAAWAWLMAALLWQAWKVRRRCRAGRWLIDGAIAGWVAFMVEGFFEFNFGTSPVLMVFLFVVSTPFVVERLEAVASENSSVH